MSRSKVSPTELVVGMAAIVFVFASTLIITDIAHADPRAVRDAPVLIEASDRSLASLIELAPSRPQPEPGDAIAALQAVDIALTQAGDGAAYVWRRDHGRLTGAVRPTMTFRDADRRICRHIEIEMRLGTYTRRTEGIACRGTDGVWALEG